MAEAIAEAVALPLLTVRYDSLVGAYLGETNVRLSRLFDYARTMPCVLFFDEFDAIGKERGDVHETGEIKRVVSFLLMQIDQLPSYVIAVAATNHAELLDRAVWRRFQLRIEMPAPDLARAALLLQRCFGAVEEDPGLSAESIAKRMMPTNYAEILDFYQNVRRRHILAQGGESFRQAVARELELWDLRVTPTHGSSWRPGARWHGIRVAVPPNPPSAVNTGRTIGTSVAAALTTGIAVRAHEILEATYDDFLQLPGAQRALLLKGLLVHCTRWTEARDLIIEILGPPQANQHVRQKDNVRRYIGYGAIDGGIILNCAADRATLWAVGNLAREQGHNFSLPLPAAMSGRAQLHELAATLSWFAPPRFGAVNYRGARLKLLEPDGLSTIGVAANKEQPDTNQSHRGTIIHRRWSGERAAALVQNQTVPVIVQREPDEVDETIPYALVTTVTMPGVNEIYAQVRAKVSIKPKIPVAV